MLPLVFGDLLELECNVAIIGLIKFLFRSKICFSSFRNINDKSRSDELRSFRVRKDRSLGDDVSLNELRVSLSVPPERCVEGAALKLRFEYGSFGKILSSGRRSFPSFNETTA